MTDRRQFLQMAAATAALTALDVEEIRASTASPAPQGKWDLSWVERIKSAKYPVAWNSFDVNDGLTLDLTGFFLDHYHEIYNTKPEETLPVIVFRKVGTAPAYNDAMWAKYNLGQVENLKQPNGEFQTRNPFAPKFAALQQRNAIGLCCNLALSFYARKLAAAAGATPQAVADDLRANLLPGVILVPSGIFALTHAQHAGAVYMLGS